MLRAFLAERRLKIRKKLFNSRRASYFFLSGGLEGEMAKGWVFALPALFAFTTHSDLSLILILSVLAVPGIGYAIFAGTVGFKAYAEWSDTFYDRHTKKHLSPEYRSAESATTARRKRRLQKSDQ